MSPTCFKPYFLLFSLIPAIAFSQNELDLSTENGLSINHNFSNRYSASLEIGTRAYLYTNEEPVFKTRQVEFSHFSNYKLNLKSSLSLGLKYRNRTWFEASSNEIRLTQQYKTKTLLKTLDLRHRFRSEQRFYEHKTVFRYRYQLNLVVPLKGTTLEVNETYFELSNEALWSISKTSKPQLENRLSPSLGILLMQDLNLEFGVEYRAENLNSDTQHDLFFNTSIELKI